MEFRFREGLVFDYPLNYIRVYLYTNIGNTHGTKKGPWNKSDPTKSARDFPLEKFFSFINQ